jgi:hypothetical protein
MTDAPLLFALTDGVTRRDRNGLDCPDDAAAITKAISIACEITTSGNNCHSDLHISIMRRGHEVSRVPVHMNQAAPAVVNSPSASQIRPVAKENNSHIEILLVEDRPGQSSDNGSVPPLWKASPTAPFMGWP